MFGASAPCLEEGEKRDPGQLWHDCELLAAAVVKQLKKEWITRWPRAARASFENGRAGICTVLSPSLFNRFQVKVPRSCSYTSTATRQLFLRSQGPTVNSRRR
ncbi:hypothetical protein J3E69DRAFT_343082 [Trichoderma sp. SZMC 28015]